MLTIFQSRPPILSEGENLGNVDKIGHSFHAAPMFIIAGEDQRSILALTLELIPCVGVTMRGKRPFVTALNDIRQTETEGWVCFLNGQIPVQPLDICPTRRGDFLVWVFLPVRDRRSAVGP